VTMAGCMKDHRALANGVACGRCVCGGATETPAERDAGALWQWEAVAARCLRRGIMKLVHLDGAVSIFPPLPACANDSVSGGPIGPSAESDVRLIIRGVTANT